MVRQSYTLLTFLCLVLELCSCSSLQKKAEKLYEAESYEEAASTYEEILAENPKDEDAQIGLKKCRIKVIDTELIQVRKSRLGGNGQNSLDMLLKIVGMENEWSFYPKGLVANTQDEETLHAKLLITKLVRDFTKKLQPLPASLLLEKYKPIFQGTQLQGYQALNAEVAQTGSTICRNLTSRSDAKHPYFALFVEKFCAKWGNAGRQIASAKNFKNLEMFSKARVSLNLKNVPPSVISTFSEAIETGLKVSPWYSADGKKTLDIKLSGAFARKTNVQHEIRQHSFTIREPYTGYQPVTKTRQVPYASSEYQCAYASNGVSVCGSVPTTAYRTEYYTENEPVTMYRDIPHVKDYDGNRIYQMLFLTIKGDAKVSQSKINISLVQKDEQEGFEHQWNLPEIGLHPEKADLPDPLDWLKEQAAAISNEVLKKSTDLWSSKYCKPLPGKPGIVESGEQIHRCLRLKKEETPDFVVKWYRNYFGVSPEEAQGLLGLNDF